MHIDFVMCKNSPRAPPFTFFGTMRLTGDQKIQKFQKKIRDFFFNFCPHAGTVEENTLNFEVLLLFWRLFAMAPTWAVPGLLFYTKLISILC